MNLVPRAISVTVVLGPGNFHSGPLPPGGVNGAGRLFTNNAPSRYCVSSRRSTTDTPPYCEVKITSLWRAAIHSTEPAPLHGNQPIAGLPSGPGSIRPWRIE